jgi:chemotaxis protein methyltransferase CheR
VTDPGRQRERDGAEPDDPELDAILDEVRRRMGIDGAGYDRRPLARRLRRRASEEGLAGLPGLRDRLRSGRDDHGLWDRVASDFSVRATSMFRDPAFFRTLRSEVLPTLGAAPATVWVAGCATGEEVWSLGICLAEAGLLSRVQVVATDVDEDALASARAAVVPLLLMRQYTGNYLASGGSVPFSEFYRADHRGAAFDAALLENVVFVHHDVARDPPVRGASVVLCRNVLLHFDAAHRRRAWAVLDAACAAGGWIGLGAEEQPDGERSPRYRRAAPDSSWFRKEAVW